MKADRESLMGLYCQNINRRYVLMNNDSRTRQHIPLKPLQFKLLPILHPHDIIRHKDCTVTTIAFVT